MKPSEKDMNDVIERLTEQPDDIVVQIGEHDPTKPHAGKFTRSMMNQKETTLIETILIRYPSTCHFLKSFTDADGKRWTPD